MSFRSTHRICSCLLLGLCFLCTQNICAQKRAAYILDTATAPETEKSYRISFSTSAKAVTVSFPLRGSHAFNLRAEHFRSSSIPRSFERLHQVTADWKFRSLPVTASYTYALPSPTSWVFPVVGAGLSAHIYRQTEKLDQLTRQPYKYVLETLDEPLTPFFADQRGLNYGAELSLGLIMNVSENIFIMSQGRYRYIACANHKYRYGALNVLDFSLDIGFEF